MNSMHSAVARRSPAALYLFVEMARCWSKARRGRRPALTMLHSRVGHYGCGPLLPALDSMFALTTTLLGRPLRPGRSAGLSDDENMLINLLQGRRVAALGHQCSEALLCTFCCAVRSVQLLMDMELGREKQAAERMDRAA